MKKKGFFPLKYIPPDPLKQGYIYCPYLLVESINIISDSFDSSMFNNKLIKSRYYVKGKED
jgi:hypothetical protein